MTDLEQLQKFIQELTDAGGVGTRVYKGKSLDLAALVRAYNALAPEEDAPWYSRALSAVSEAVSGAIAPIIKTGKIQDAEGLYKLRRDQLLALSQDTVPGRSSAWVRQQRKTWRDDSARLLELHGAAQGKLLRLDPNNELLAQEARGQYAERTTTATGEQAVAQLAAEAQKARIGALRGQVAAAERGQAMAEAAGGAAQVVPGGTATRATGKAAAGKPAVAAPSEWVETQLELRGLADTPENRKTLQGEYKSQKPTAWNDQVQEEFLTRFPQFRYLFDPDVWGDSAEQVKNIMVRAVTEQWFRYPTTAQAILKRLVASTPYGVRSTDAQESFDASELAEQNAKIDSEVTKLKGLYGNLGLSDDVWRVLGRTAARNKLDEAQTRANLFKTLYEQTPEGTMRYDNAVKVLEQGKLGQDVRKVYRNYLFNPDGANVSDDIEAYTTGVKTIADIERQLQTLAKQAMPALASSIDQGLTAKQVADTYAAYAADILEVPVQSIDMSVGKFRKALDGDKLMSISEWQRTLKSDPNYGWQYTSTANKQAMDVATAIARAFGAIK
jgi:hypothetical protein